MDDYDYDDFEVVTPSDQISEVPMINYEGKVNQMFDIKETE